MREREAATEGGKNLLAALARFDQIRTLSNSARNVLAETAIIKSPAKSDAILHKGERVSGAYLVLTGRLRVFTVAANGAEATLYFLDPGDTCVLAINCLFNDLLYPAWVEAETPASVAVIPGSVYRMLFESERAIQSLTVEALSALVYRLMAELEQVHASNHRQRLAHFLLTHGSAEGVLRMTQQQIAGHLGTTREVIARLIQDFVARGFVRSQRGAVAILNVAGLREIVAPGR